MFRPMACLAALAFVVSLPPAFAATDSPVGTWRQIDDATGDAKSIIQITAANGELQGKVLKVLKSDHGPHPLCKECEGERHNQPVEGMTILWGLQQDGNEWSGGHILDPGNGKTYKCKLELLDGGSKLKVRGYIGFSLLGRSQVWERMPEPEPAPAEAPAAAATTAPAEGTSSPAMGSTVAPASTSSNQGSEE